MEIEKVGNTKRSNKDVIERKMTRVARETTMMYRYFIAVGLMILGIISVNFLRGGIAGYQAIKYGLTPTIIVFALVLVFAVINFVRQRKAGRDESTSAVTSSMFLLFSIISLVYFISYKLDFGGQFADERIITIVALTVLYFIYNIYEAAFFVASAQLAIGLAAIDFCSNISHSQSLRMIAAAVAIVVAVAGGIVTFKLLTRKNGENHGQIKLYIMSAIVIAAVLLSLFVTGISTYAIFTLVAAYLVIAVISTIEMM